MNEMLGMSGSQTGPEEGMRKVGRGKMMLMMKQEDGEER